MCSSGVALRDDPHSTRTAHNPCECSYLNVLETRRACVWDLHLDSISTQLTVSVLFDSADVAVLLEAGAELLVHVELLFGG